MTHRARAFCTLLVVIFIQSSPAASPLTDLGRLYEEKRYFDLRDALSDYRGEEPAELLFYRGVVGNRFNRPESSAAHLEGYLRRAKKGRDADRLVACYALLADNYLKTYRYRKAAGAYSTILTRFGRHIDAERKADFTNAVKLWGALARAPRQTARFGGDSTIRKDREGHVPLEINGRKAAFIFDTGANLSVVTKSLAEKHALKALDAHVDVAAIAGNTVRAGLALARKIKIGNVTISNAVFLVFEDKDLYISEANFQIEGLIGFPVIEALRVVTFVGEDQIFIPAAAVGGGEQNMCLEGLSPLIAGRFRGERLTFTLDTGADRTTLYPPFYERYEDEIKDRYKTYSERVRGVGGHREIRGYLAEDISIEFSGREARLTRVPVLAEYTLDKSRYFHGNIGQDLIRQYKRMTLNFDAMSVVFE